MKIDDLIKDRKLKNEYYKIKNFIIEENNTILYKDRNLSKKDFEAFIDNKNRLNFYIKLREAIINEKEKNKKVG